MRRWLCALVTLVASGLAVADEIALRVADAYVELHTAPGRAYPVFHVAARGEALTLLLRHTDWVKVRTERGQVGWVALAQLDATLAAAGALPAERQGWRDALRGRLLLGAAAGRFAGEPMLQLGLRARFAEGVSAQLDAGQVQGLYSGTDFWRLNATLDPWSDRVWSPFFTLGVGHFRDLPNLSLVDAGVTDARLANAGIGLRRRLTPRFVLHAEWTLYTAFLSDQRSREYRALTGGVSFSF